MGTGLVPRVRRPSRPLAPPRQERVEILRADPVQPPDAVVAQLAALDVAPDLLLGELQKLGDLLDVPESLAVLRHSCSPSAGAETKDLRYAFARLRKRDF